MIECLLCRVRRHARKQYSDRKFWVADCLVCGKPIIVSVAHVVKISERDEEKAMQIVKDLFGEAAKFKTAPHINNEHWHEHLST